MITETIYTLDYYGWSLITVLQQVETTRAKLVDIRLNPWSPDPSWRGHKLARLVGPDNYVHVKEYGNRNYKSGGPIELADPVVGASKVAAILVKRPVILLCACQALETCHRLVAAEHLSGWTGAPVVHLEPPRTVRVGPALLLTDWDQGRGENNG